MSAQMLTFLQTGFITSPMNCGTAHTGIAAKRGRLVVLLLVVLTSCTLASAARGGAEGQIHILSDRETPPGASQGCPESPVSPGPAPANHIPPAQSQPSHDDTLALKRVDLLRTYEPQRQEEEGLMRGRVQILDRETAASWMASFLSAKPLNCPIKDQRVWIEAILYSVERNSLPICKEILGLVASIISIESGFHADPPCVDRSRGEDMASMIERAEKQFLDQMGSAVSVPPLRQLYAMYRDKYRPKLLGCMTEGQVEAVAGQICEDLKKDSSRLPDFARRIVDSELERLKHVVRTKGSMQLNFTRARCVMRERGEQFTDDELTRYIYSAKGGVDVGVAALKPMFVQYAARCSEPGNMSWLFLVGMDYHYGPFSSRNMMEQIRIRDLSQHQIALDGDFLCYDAKASPLSKDSATLQAAVSIFPNVTKEEVVKALLLEKDPHYIYTDLHRALSEAHRERFGETPFAVVGDLRVGKGAQIKHGFTWRTRSYLKKLDRYLNSIPWEQ